MKTAAAPTAAMPVETASALVELLANDPPQQHAIVEQRIRSDPRMRISDAESRSGRSSSKGRRSSGSDEGGSVTSVVSPIPPMAAASRIPLSQKLSKQMRSPPPPPMRRSRRSSFVSTASGSSNAMVRSSSSSVSSSLTGSRIRSHRSHHPPSLRLHRITHTEASSLDHQTAANQFGSDDGIIVLDEEAEVEAANRAAANAQPQPEWMTDWISHVMQADGGQQQPQQVNIDLDATSAAAAAAIDSSVKPSTSFFPSVSSLLSSGHDFSSSRGRRMQQRNKMSGMATSTSATAAAMPMQSHLRSWSQPTIPHARTPRSIIDVDNFDGAGSARNLVGMSQTSANPMIAAAASPHTIPSATHNRAGMGVVLLMDDDSDEE